VVVEVLQLVEVEVEVVEVVLLAGLVEQLA
jgi:hypothetical protein